MYYQFCCIICYLICVCFCFIFCLLYDHTWYFLVILCSFKGYKFLVTKKIITIISLLNCEVCGQNFPCDIFSLCDLLTCTILCLTYLNGQIPETITVHLIIWSSTSFQYSVILQATVYADCQNYVVSSFHEPIQKLSLLCLTC